MNINPVEIAKQRQNERKELHVEQRRVVALELIADTLEAIRQDLAEAIARLPQKTH